MKSVSTNDTYVHNMSVDTDLCKGPKQFYGITAYIFSLSQHKEQEPNQG